MDDTTPRGAICGPDGCELPATAPVATLHAEPAVGTRIDIVSDAICPWCYIGKRQLEAALATLAAEGLHFSVHWNPFQLNPDMPKEGVDRAAYRAAKFGSAERAREIDARVAGAAASGGPAVPPGPDAAHAEHDRRAPADLVRRPPEGHEQAHNLGMNRAGRTRRWRRCSAAYFIQGRDIGDAAVLADCAARGRAGPRRGDRVPRPATWPSAEMRAADQAAREAGVNGVPSFFLDGYSLFSGAMPAARWRTRSATADDSAPARETYRRGRGAGAARNSARRGGAARNPPRPVSRPAAIRYSLAPHQGGRFTA